MLVDVYNKPFDKRYSLRYHRQSNSLCNLKKLDGNELKYSKFSQTSTEISSNTLKWAKNIDVCWLWVWEYRCWSTFIIDPLTRALALGTFGSQNVYAIWKTTMEISSNTLILAKNIDIGPLWVCEYRCWSTFIIDPLTRAIALGIFDSQNVYPNW